MKASAFKRRRSREARAGVCPHLGKGQRVPRRRKRHDEAVALGVGLIATVLVKQLAQQLVVQVHHGVHHVHGQELPARVGHFRRVVER